jgi:hypothetical protein
MALGHMTTEDLRAVVEAFADITWPAPREAIYPVGERLGWTLERDRRNGIDYLTPYGFSRGRAGVTVSDGLVAEVRVHVTDRMDDEDPELRPQLVAAFKELRGLLEQLLGNPAHTRLGADPRVSWDLPSGGRVA